MEIEGRIILIRDTQQVSDRFRKREFVIEDSAEPEHPQVIQFELAQDRCDLIDGYSVGQTVNVHFNIRGRKWSAPAGDKYFVSLNAWRLQKVDFAPAGIPDEPPPLDAAQEIPKDAGIDNNIPL